MSIVKYALNFTFIVICTVCLCTYIGYRLNNILIGIIVGFVLAISYIIYKALHGN